MKYFFTFLSALTASAIWAQGGYEIKVTLKPFKNQYIYLGHYLGKQMPIIDSVKLNDKSEGVFKGSKPLGGGIYLIGYPDRVHNFEILMDKAQHFSVVADTLAIQKVSFLNSPANTSFKAYQAFMNTNGHTIDSLYKRRAGSSAADSLRLTAEITALDAKIKKYRTDIIAQNGDGILAVLLKAMREPEVPPNAAAAKKDSLYAYRYFKNHYWDGVNFWDDRVARTPFFEGRIDKYFEQLVYPEADSVNKELDWMLGYAGASEEMQKFLLLKFVNRYYNQKYMWEDAVFVHLYETRFADKTYSWLTDQGTKLIRDRAYSLMANITGNPASEIQLPDSNGKNVNLYGVEAPFTLVTIWDPTCGHCKEMLPRLDSAYRASWKAKGVKMFAMAKETDGTRSDWTSFISSHHLGDWTNVYYSKEADKKRVDGGTPGYGQLYDVQSFPTIYLLDKDKRIMAKKVTLEQVDQILALKLNTK